MRSCEVYQEWASCLIDGELDAACELELRQHAAHCEACRTALEAFTALSDGIGDALVEPPETLHNNVMAEIRRESVKPVTRPPLPYRRQWAMAAGLAVVLLAGLAIARQNRAEDSAAGVMTAAAPVQEDVEIYAAAEAEFAQDSLSPATGSARRSAENGIRFEAAAADKGNADEAEKRELTAAQAETLRAALGEMTDESPMGEPLLLTWTDKTGVSHIAELWDNVCTVDGDHFILTADRAELLERLFDGEKAQ